MRDQIHKDSYPELGCSGDLNPTVTVHLVNVGTSCLGGNTGLAAVDVRHGGRESRVVGVGESPAHGEGLYRNFGKELRL